MLEPDLLQQQREILRALRQAIAQHVQAEAKAKAALSKTRGQAKARLDKIHDKLKAAQDILVAGFKVRLTTGREGTDPAHEMERCVSIAHNSLESLEKSKIPGCSKAALAYVGTMIIIVPIVAIGFFICFALILQLESSMDEALIWLCLFGASAIVVLGPVPVLLFWDRKRRAKVRRYSQTLAQAVADAEFWYERWLAQAQARYRQTMGNIAQTFRQEMARLRPTFVDFTHKTGLLGAPWDDPAWQEWVPADAPASVVRFGELKIGVHQDYLNLPALLPFIGGRNLLLEVSNAAKDTAVRAIQSLMLRLLATIPPGKLRFLLIDPVGLGQSVAAFMHLADYDEALVTSKAWTEPSHIERQLADLSAHMETVIQKFLRDKYPTMEAYNAEAGEVAEPYRVLVVMNFPVNFTDAAARRLVSITANGPRCGVYTLITVDTQQPLPYGFNLADLERSATIIAHSEARFLTEKGRLEEAIAEGKEAAARKKEELLARLEVEKLTTETPSVWKDEGLGRKEELERSLDNLEAGDRFVWQDEDFKDCLLELDDPPPTRLFDRILPVVGAAAKEASHVEVPFGRIAPPSELWWRGDTRDGFVAPLGRAGATKVQVLDLGKGTAQHALVAGKTGAGKSTLLHTLIATLTLTYSPNELELYLVDFKKGVEFKTYAIHELPHARVVAIESEREFGLSVLQGLDAELKHRGDLFRAAGVDHIADYRPKLPSPDVGRGAGGEGCMPRILLLVDEFQEFFTEDDAIASQSSQILDRLVRQGRAFGMHVLLGSQTLAGTYTLARSTIDQMAVRIALQCSEADSRLILADDNPAARLLSRPGEAIYNAANGLVEGNNLFQVAWLPDEKRDAYLQRLREMMEKQGYVPPQPQIVFEGNAPAVVTKNRPLHDLLAAPTWPAPSRVVRAWLGEPIAIREPVAAVFRRQSGSNLLIVGQNDEAALAMMSTALISLAAQLPSPDVGRGAGGEGSFYVLDFGAVDAPYADFFRHFASYLSHPVKIGRRRQLPEMIAELAIEVQRRLDTDEISAPSKYLFIYGLQRARDLRLEEGFGLPSFGEKAPPSPAHQFTIILREGPDLGVHTVVWCDTLTNLNRSLDRRALREFAMRVVFQMSAEDSANLIDTPTASKLGSYRALFYSEEEGRLEKFRPYGLPSEAWLTWVEERLRGKEVAHGG